HAAADPGVAGSGEALFPPPRTALVRRARQTGVARHRFAVTHWSREHLMGGFGGRWVAEDDFAKLPPPDTTRSSSSRHLRLQTQSVRLNRRANSMTRSRKRAILLGSTRWSRTGAREAKIPDRA